MAKKSANIDDVKIGIKVREARISLGITQNELGRYFSVSGQQIQKFESGFNKLSAKNLFIMSRISKKPMDWFIDELSNKYIQVNPRQYSEEENFMNTAVRNLRRIRSESERNKIIKIIKIFNEKLIDGDAEDSSG